jgi:hypothetical protein
MLIRYDCTADGLALYQEKSKKKEKKDAQLQ